MLSDQAARIVASIGRRKAYRAGKEPPEMETRQEMSTAWTGWIGFAAIMLMIVGSITFFEGLIAIIRGDYYTVTANQIIVFNLSTWGWIMLFWGIALFCGGLGLAAGSGWARWFAIIVVGLNLLAQLGFVGSSTYPLWTLCVITLEIIVLFALTARWGRAEPM
jgi:hypothetical protein